MSVVDVIVVLFFLQIKHLVADFYLQTDKMVAVIKETSYNVDINKKDLLVEWYSGTGAGGQHRNRHLNSCRITHIPTGIVATAQCRSRNNSYTEALKTIESRVSELTSSNNHQKIATTRKEQVGSGM